MIGPGSSASPIFLFHARRWLASRLFFAVASPFLMLVVDSTSGRFIKTLFIAALGPNHPDGQGGRSKISFVIEKD